MADRDLHLFSTDGFVPNVASNYFFFRQSKVQRKFDFSQRGKKSSKKNISFAFKYRTSFGYQKSNQTIRTLIPLLDLGA